MSDERFERDLRAVLADAAPDTVPTTLRASLQRVVAVTRIGGAGSSRVLHRAGPVLAGLASLAVIGLIVGIVVVYRTGSAPGFGGAPSDASPSPTPAFLWDSGVVRLAADEARITAGGREFLVEPGPISIDSDPGSETYQTLELEWREHGREMRLYLYLHADGERWWLDELRTRDGREPAEWVTYPGPLLRAPLGEPFTGDIERTSPDGQDGFRLEGMRLEAFQEGRTRSDREGCQPLIAPQPSQDGGVTDLEPGVVEGLDLTEMTPAEVAAWLAERDVCVTWRYTYRTDANNQATGFAEYWCTPPEGEIGGGYVDESDGTVTVFVRPIGNPVLDMRPQPPLGWGCD